MKKIFIFLTAIIVSATSYAQTSDVYETSVTFPANYIIGDYIEFVKVQPLEVSASGYYEVSISYTRGSIAAAATYIVSASHSNPTLWREASRVNANNYTSANYYSFTVDCNTQPNNTRFRVRALATYGVSALLPVYIKIRSINRNLSWTALSQTGNDISVIPLLPMTADWTLTTGKLSSTTSANIALHADVNGNVGIGTKTPAEKLSVNGNIRAKQIKVEQANWPDYVFDSSYQLKPLAEVEKFIEANKHLPDVPSASVVAKEGIELGSNQALLLKKIEELTLHLININKRVEQLETENKFLKKERLKSSSTIN